MDPRVIDELIKYLASNNAKLDEIITVLGRIDERLESHEEKSKNRSAFQTSQMLSLKGATDTIKPPHVLEAEQELVRRIHVSTSELSEHSAEARETRM